MNKIELLAPAGSLESLYAAVQNGADAVYLGGSKFSARAYASNFDYEKMIEAVNYCHIYGVKIYVTVNTLLKDSEINESMEYIKFLYTIGVDALIVQDTGLFYLIKKNFPDFELHASTQMTVHNGEGAKLLSKLGFKRIVLSRELSLNEIQYISKELNIETEIFVHGALCVCYSGQCLMSSVIGGRSGNRGRCAQTCRLPNTIINKKTGESKSGYLLSTKDICTLQDVKNIIESGTSSLKIEGRMKRPEYVAGVVDIYRRAIDSVYAKGDFDYQKEVKQLMQLFNREGFSKAYMFGNVGKDMMAYTFPKNTGIQIGKVEKDSTIRLMEDVQVKDGVRVGEEGFSVSKIIKEGKEVSRAEKGDRIKILPAKYKASDIIYKTLNEELMNNLADTFKNPYGKKISLELQVRFKLDEPIALWTRYLDKDFYFEGDRVQEAINKPLDKEKIIQNLNKTGDVPFQFSNINFEYYDQGFIPVSSLNLARRNLLEMIGNYIISKSKREFPKGLNLNREKLEDKGSIPDLMVSVKNLEQLNAAISAGAENIIVDIFARNSDIKINEIDNSNLYLKVPNIIKEEFDFVCRKIDENMSYIKGIITANAGVISKYNDSIDIIGDYKLNNFNRYSMDFYSKLLKGSCLSIELNRKELGEASKNSPIPTQVLVYGKIEVMISEYCPIGSVMGGKSSKKSCGEECSKGTFVLKDRVNEEFVIKTDIFCRSYIFNSVPVNIIPNIEELRSININSFRIDFIDENKEQVAKIIRAYLSGKFTEKLDGFTRGHYKRGVE
ncbi:MAG: DUF3656 domain-containing protein [Bacillota bacterium]|nr:DUF3656 domain-containing protein [Bacillota bacterium]